MLRIGIVLSIFKVSWAQDSLTLSYFGTKDSFYCFPLSRNKTRRVPCTIPHSSLCWQDTWLRVWWCMLSWQQMLSAGELYTKMRQSRDHSSSTWVACKQNALISLSCNFLLFAWHLSDKTPKALDNLIFACLCNYSTDTDWKVMMQGDTSLLRILANSMQTSWLHVLYKNDQGGEHDDTENNSSYRNREGHECRTSEAQIQHLNHLNTLSLPPVKSFLCPS